MGGGGWKSVKGARVEGGVAHRAHLREEREGHVRREARQGQEGVAWRMLKVAMAIKGGSACLGITEASLRDRQPDTFTTMQPAIHLHQHWATSLELDLRVRRAPHDTDRI